MTPFERILLDHDEELPCSAPNKDEFIAPSILICNTAKNRVSLNKGDFPIVQGGSNERTITQI
jgi:hypothetical protein